MGRAAAAVAEAALAALLLVVLPVLAMASRKRFQEGRVPKGRALFLQVLVQLLVLGGLATLVAIVAGRPIVQAPRHATATIVASAAFLAIAAGTIPWRWRRATPSDRERLRQLLPTRRDEAIPWLLVCVAAGWAEELAYRGVLAASLADWTGSVVAGALISALAFGAAHAVQGWRSAAVIVGFALGFQALCALSGSLLPAMIVHAAYDAIAGWLYARLAAADAAKDLPAT